MFPLTQLRFPKYGKCFSRVTHYFRWSGSLYSSFHFCASLQKQSPEYGSVTAPFVVAIAADGEVRFVRKSGEKVKCSAFLRGRHLSSVFTQEHFPSVLSLSTLAYFDCFWTWCQVWEPYVIPVLRSILTLGHAAGRTPDCPNPNTFTRDSLCPETNNAHCHDYLLWQSRLWNLAVPSARATIYDVVSQGRWSKLFLHHTQLTLRSARPRTEASRGSVRLPA
jgi:hypothetical protein